MPPRSSEAAEGVPLKLSKLSIPMTKKQAGLLALTLMAAVDLVMGVSIVNAGGASGGIALIAGILQGALAGALAKADAAENIANRHRFLVPAIITPMACAFAIAAGFGCLHLYTLSPPSLAFAPLALMISVIWTVAASAGLGAAATWASLTLKVFDAPLKRRPNTRSGEQTPLDDSYDLLA